MISKSSILHNLSSLEKKYQSAKNGKDALFYSKLAILELCGWIEESMDDVVRRCSQNILKNLADRKYVEEVVIKKTYAFDYSRFRLMLIHLVGLINVERIEKKIDPLTMSRLDATLRALKKARDAEAHTHLKGVTRNVNAPSLTLAQFTDVYEGLKCMERILKTTKF